MEQKRYGKAEWISHTNEDRMRLFTEEKPGLPKAALNVLPNYPPFSWYHLKKNPVLDEGQTKVVYVGALSMHTMYTREFAAWIVEQQGRYTWDIFSDNCSQEVKDFLKALNCRFISLNPAVAYHQLPALLRQYSVGVVLYNGHIPNYVYNVPNKVLEYYACGLEVWCSHDLASTVDFKKRHQLDSIRIIDFTTEKKGDVESNSKTDDKKTGSYRKIFSSEDVYSKLMERMIA